MSLWQYMTRTGNIVIKNQSSQVCQVSEVFYINLHFLLFKIIFVKYILHIHLFCQHWNVVILGAGFEKQNKISLTFFLLEGVRHDGICSGNQGGSACALNSKQWAKVQEAKGGLFCTSKKSLFTEINLLFYLTMVRSSTAKTQPAQTVFTRVVFFWQVICSRMQSLTGPPHRPLPKLEGWSCLQCKRAPSLSQAVAEQLWWSLMSVSVQQDGNASGKAGTAAAAGLKWVKSTEHASC